jgi:hypothetical protein
MTLFARLRGPACTRQPGCRRCEPPPYLRGSTSFAAASRSDAGRGRGPRDWSTGQLKRVSGLATRERPADAAVGHAVRCHAPFESHLGTAAVRTGKAGSTGGRPLKHVASNTRTTTGPCRSRLYEGKVLLPQARVQPLVRPKTAPPGHFPARSVLVDTPRRHGSWLLDETRGAGSNAGAATRASSWPPPVTRRRP